jgi:preprotein translocase subunit YajC
MLLSTLLFFAQVVEKAAEKAPPKGGEAPGWGFLMPLILMGIVFYFFIIVPNRRQRKQQEQMLGSLKKNDEVITSAGIIGIVGNIKDEEVTLKIDDNVRMRILRSSIIRILTPRDAKDEAAKSDTSQNVKADK